MFGRNAFGGSQAYQLNEAVFWDGVETPSTYGARTDFITASAFEGYSRTDPGVANVRNGTAYTYAGVALTGTAVIPTLANTKTGVAGDGGTGTYDGSDRWTSPLAAELLSGVQLKSNSTSLNLTGTFTTPTAAQIAAEILDTQLVETGYSIRKGFKLMLAALAGKVSGAPTTGVVIRNVGDTKNRITATVDANGNRTALTYDTTD